MNKNYRPLTQSMIADFNWCQMLYYWEYIRLLVLDTFHFPFIVGAASHEGVLTILKYKNLDKALKIAESVMFDKRNEFEKRNNFVWLNS